MFKQLQSIHKSLLTERDRWVLWSPVGLALGISGYFSLQQEPAAWSGATILALSCGLLYLTLRLPVRFRLRQGAFALAVTAGLLALGFTAAQLRTWSVNAPVFEKPISSATVQGQVRLVERLPTGVRVTLENLKISRVEPHQTPNRIRLNLHGNQPQIEPGVWISARAGLSPPGAPSIPGGFDFQRHSFFQEIGGYGFSFGAVKLTTTTDNAGAPSPRRWLAQLRNDISLRLINGLAAPYGGLAAALITGEKHAVDEQIVENLRNSGLAHLLSISGLHIGLVAGIVFTGTRYLLLLLPGLALRWPIKKGAAVSALLAAFLYALLAGATLPTQRAFLMAALALLAVIIDRRGISLRSVAWAAFVVLLVQPESLLGPSFQMSFAAATALVAAYEAVRTYREGRWKSAVQTPPKRGLWAIAPYFGGICLTTLVASAATAPFALYHFNQFADFSLVANLAAIPVTALWVMPWAVVSVLVLPLGLESWALLPMGWGLHLVVSIADTVAHWPGSVTRLPTIPSWGITLIALSGAWMVIWRHKWRFLAIPPMLCGLLSTATVVLPDVIVDSDARLFAINLDEGPLVYSAMQRAAFTRDIWTRSLGATQISSLSETAPWIGGDTHLSCDVSGCLLKKAKTTIAIVRTEYALVEDCWLADVVIALMPIRRRCPAEFRIDRFDLWRYGAHSITVTESGVRIRSVNPERGNRPWVLRPDKSPAAAVRQPES